jgi:glycerol-3-phosphate cytidylyltransferase
MRVMVDMSATLLHHGHVRLIGQARQHGEVVVGLTSDAEIRAHKGYVPELSFVERKEILEALADVAEVVETPWLITEEVLNEYRIDLLVHGDDNSNGVAAERLMILPRTEGVSSTQLRQRATASLVAIENRKLMLTPGPAALLYENVAGLKPVFGRGDDEFTALSARVHNWLLELSGQDEIISMQGSATMALELGVRNLVSGRMLLIDTGYYADRMAGFTTADTAVDRVSYTELAGVTGAYDWVVCCYTETSCAFKADLGYIRSEADRLGARLFLETPLAGIRVQ